MTSQIKGKTMSRCRQHIVRLLASGYSPHPRNGIISTGNICCMVAGMVQIQSLCIQQRLKGIDFIRQGRQHILAIRIAIA